VVVIVSCSRDVCADSACFRAQLAHLGAERVYLRLALRGPLHDGGVVLRHRGQDILNPLGPIAHRGRVLF
jgi:hypothetical protein